jgi:NhaP-type Na+/H+ and K+/H+ antiporter
MGAKADGEGRATRKEDQMLWTIAVVLIIFWMLGLVTGYVPDLFIHGLYAIAVVLLLISINREVNIYRGLKHMVHKRNRTVTSSSVGL